MSPLRKTFAICIGSVLSLGVVSLPIVAQDTKPQVAINQPTANESVSTETTTKSDEEIAKEIKNLSSTYLRRVGVNALQTRSLSLNQAIKLALNNNNNIEIARDDVRIAELSLRSLLGTYDPTINFSPNFDRNATNGQTATKDLRVNSDFTQLLRKGGGNYRVFF